jgi:hypothetical protein
MTVLIALYVSIVGTLTLLHSYNPETIIKSLSKYFISLLVLFIGCAPSIQERFVITERVDSVYIPGDTVFVQSLSDTLYIVRDSTGSIVDVSASLDTTVDKTSLRLNYQLSLDRWTVNITKKDTVIKYNIIDTSKTIIVDRIIEKTPIWIYPLLAAVALVIILGIVLAIKGKI